MTARVVYLLRAERSRRTYVGATVDLARRLRQHNAELRGGARRTATGGPWRLHCHVEGFRTWQECLQFEFAWRRVGRRHVRRWDVEGRLRALAILMSRERWSSNACLAAEVPLRVVTSERALQPPVRPEDALDVVAHPPPCVGAASQPLAPAQLAQGHAVAIEHGPDQPAAQRLPPLLP